MTITDTSRDDLAAQVHGIAAACHVCGVEASCPVSDAVVLPDRVRGTGELVFATCADCLADRGTDRHRTAVAEILGLDPEDPAIVGITIQTFSDQPGASPKQGGRERWTHVSRTSLAEQVERNRTNLDRRRCPAKEGCAFCGVNVTPEGTTWRAVREGQSCGSCSARGARQDTGEGVVVTYPLRDAVAATLAGYVSRTQSSVPPGLGAQVGVVFAHEVPLKKGSDRPWEHLDLAAVRARVKDLRDRKAHTVPGWFREDKLPTVIRW